MRLARKRLIPGLAVMLLVVAAGACNEPVEFFGPGRSEIRNPSILAVGSTSVAPSGYLGIYAEPADPTLRFELHEQVLVDVYSPTGDSLQLPLGPRYCEEAPRQYTVCHEYVLILDTTVAVAEVRGRLREAGYVINTLGDNRFAVAFDVLRRPHSPSDLARLPSVLSAGSNSIGWLDLPPTDLGGKGLFGAIELTRGPSPSTDHLLSVPDTGSVTLRYRQPNGTVLTQRVSFTPRF
jgi:hypothetical protein